MKSMFSKLLKKIKIMYKGTEVKLKEICQQHEKSENNGITSPKKKGIINFQTKPKKFVNFRFQ